MGLELGKKNRLRSQPVSGKWTASHFGWLVAALLFLQLFSPSRAVAQDLGALRYEHRTTLDPLSLHILEFQPELYDLRLVRAGDKGVGRETVAAMSKRTEALAAINGGFFRIGGEYDGEPTGILKVGRHWFSDSPVPHAAIGWTADGSRVEIGEVKMEWRVQLGAEVYTLDGINRPRGAVEVLLFTSSFSDSTLTAGGGKELLIVNDRVDSVWEKGNAAIPRDGYVISFGSRREEVSQTVPIGMRVDVSYRFVTRDGQDADYVWRGLDCIVSGRAVLMEDGKAYGAADFEGLSEGFALNKHPRTAVGVKADGTRVLVVVDGRRPGVSVGMTLPELAGLMQSLGCVKAINLDGGGSSTLFLFGSVVNLPSDLTGERPVSDALLVQPRPSSDEIGDTHVIQP